MAKKDEKRYEKDMILKRVTEIIRDYLFDVDESYAYISMYFEKNNGESQAKVLRFGHPSKDTPDLHRDYPEGFTDEHPFSCPLPECVYPSVVWRTFRDDKEWKPKAERQAEE